MDEVQELLQEAQNDVNISHDTSQALLYLAKALHEAGDVELDKAGGYIEEILDEYKGDKI